MLRTKQFLYFYHKSDLIKSFFFISYRTTTSHEDVSVLLFNLLYFLDRNSVLLCVLRAEEFVGGERNDAKEGDVGGVHLGDGLLAILNDLKALARGKAIKHEEIDNDTTNTSNHNTASDDKGHDPPFEVVVSEGNDGKPGNTGNDEEDHGDTPEEGTSCGIGIILCGQLHIHDILSGEAFTD